jgi:hypothetical protein
MKNYTSLSYSPNTNYIRFTGDRGQGGLGGLGDNLGIKNLENHETLEKREINRNSSNISETYNPYTTENIINISNSHVTRYDEDELQTIVLPFYIPIIDIVISNDLLIEIVDHSSIETKNRILCSGRIRKYRLNGIIKNYDIFIEMENENVYHVKKRGIMMRTRVNEALRKKIIKTMVNYVGDGGDIDPKNNSTENSSSDGGRSINGDDRKRVSSCFGCFKS